LKEGNLDQIRAVSYQKIPEAKTPGSNARIAVKVMEFQNIATKNMHITLVIAA
jgi:hypothetical protein